MSVSESQRKLCKLVRNIGFAFDIIPCTCMYSNEGKCKSIVERFYQKAETLAHWVDTWGDFGYME